MTVAWTADPAHPGNAPPAARAARAAQAVAATDGSGTGGAPRFRIWAETCWCLHCLGRNRWRWECAFCHPPAHGTRHGPGAWALIIRSTVPHHWRVRGQHHQRMARRIRA